MSHELLLEDIVVQIGATQILDGVSLDVPGGRIVAIVGANGAGKTTLLDVICGTVTETSGTVAIDGVTIGASGRRERIGRVFQGSPMPETLTIAEVASLATFDRTDAATLLDRFGLTPHAMSFVAELSTGMRRILDLAIATVGRPSILLLDEPASGLAQSEIDHLADVVKSYRDETGCAVLVVEHDASLVRALGDEVVVLEAGRVVARGSIDEVLAVSHARTRPRIQTPHDEKFHAALARVESTSTPSAELPKRTLSKWTLLRLGLREMSAGMASVLILGVLSRVLKTDLGVSLAVVTAILASYNLAAPIAVAIGHRSDTHPIRGQKRTPYILAGALLTGLCVAGAPHVAQRLANGVTLETVVLCLALFIAMGVGMYGSGTVFFALLTDLSGPRDRGHAASVVYLELMVGVLLGVVLTGALVKPGATDLGTLFALAGVLVVVLSTVAVWGQEKKVAPQEPSHTVAVSLRQAIKEVAAMRQARIFFGFMVATTLFLFFQQAVLTPFAGDVLHLSLRGSSSFSAMLTIGTIAGMIVAGRPFAEQMGHRRVAFYGLAGSAVAFAGLALAASASAAAPAWLSTLLLGFASGTFNVSSLALMFTMADRRRAALFMGAWTLAHAMADGTATAGGGSVFAIAHRIFGSVPGGYAGVFGLEAIGLLFCLPLLKLIDPARFAREAAGLPEEMVAETALAGAEGGALILATEIALEDPTEPAHKETPPAPIGRRNNGATSASNKAIRKSTPVRKVPAKKAAAAAKKTAKRP